MNLLFITVDDMNYTLPGFMGGKYKLTPHLDQLAKRSHRFIHNRTTAPICQPSREAMMTGLVPHHSGGLGFTPVHDGTSTLTTILQSHGYFTGCIHKLEHMQPASCFPWDFHVDGTERNPLIYEEGVKEALSQARALQKPFFINCNINDPHRPFYGSSHAAEVDHDETGPYKIVKELGADDVEVPAFLENLPPVRKEFAQYCNSAQRMDISIGKVLDVFAASPEAENTIIIFSADHGMPFPFSKATTYDSGTRTPALLSYPGMGEPRTFEDRTCNIDYMPTLLDLMGVPVPDGIDGRSWQPILHGHADYGREYLVTHVNGVSSGDQFPMRSIQNERYSLVFTPWSDGKLKLQIESMQGLTFPAMKEAGETDAKIAARVQQYVFGVLLAFYDLQSDPGQRQNILDHPENQKQVKKMKQLLLDYMKRTNDPQLTNFDLLLSGNQPVVKQLAVQRSLDKQAHIFLR
jgi:N-sulfoglucosamine sulfohydrolase